MMFIDYGIDKNCNNDATMGMICVKCGECGRKFDGGVMVYDPETGETVDANEVKTALRMATKKAIEKKNS